MPVAAIDRCIDAAIGSKRYECRCQKMPIPVTFAPSEILRAAIFKRRGQLRNDKNTIVCNIAGDVDDPVLKDISFESGRLYRTICSRSTNSAKRGCSLAGSGVYAVIRDPTP
jgi:hypothetical protein